MVELGFISKERAEMTVAQLLKSMYGNVNAALRFFKEYVKHMCSKEGMNMYQNLADPCVFVKRHEGKLVLIALTHVDDTQLCGEKEWIEWFKKGIKQRFNYTDLGKLKKHLGIWYEWKTDENGETIIIATMPKMVREIIEAYEKYIGKAVKAYTTPGAPGVTLEKNPETESVGLDAYRKIVGKIMYLVTKMYGEGANQVRELTRHFANPGTEHWKALDRFVGHLKVIEGDIKLTYRKPRELRPVSIVDSNYATDKTDRRSVSGNIHTLGGVITGWLSKTQNSVTLSVTEAEYVSASTGGQDIVFLTMLLQECGIEVKLPGVLLEDNTGAIFLIKNQQVGVRTKHIDVRWHWIREKRDTGELDVIFTKSENNESDILTKNTVESLQTKHARSMREGRLYVYMNWDNMIVKAVHKKDRREDVEI
jgi:hypothetical protein